MNNRHKHKILNKYSAWQYIVLIVILVIMLLSALPTWYGEDAAVQINNKSGLLQSPVALQLKLQDAGIKVKRITQNDKNTMVVLDDSQQQTQAKDILAKNTNDSSELTLALVPAAPSWLTNMGFEPIKLGLDLRGGVQFLLDVDVDPVYVAHQSQLMDAIRQFVREQKLRGVSVTKAPEQGIHIKVSGKDVRGTLRTFFKTNYPQWQVTNSGDEGLALVLKADERVNIRNLTVQQNLQVMRSRIEQLGITEAMVQRQGEHRIRIELPGVQDPVAAKNVIGATASLAFYAVKSAGAVNTKVLKDKSGMPVSVSRRPVLGGEHIVDARAGTDEMGRAEVNITLDSEGGKIMSDFSRANVGNPMATAYSEYSQDANGKAKQKTEIISVATIQSQLGDRFRITGAGSYQDAQQLALLLRAGSMTAPVLMVEERTIGPSLGAENIENGFAALGLGISMTLLFMALWYRRLGWVANVALIGNMVLLFGLLALIPGAVLTLPGIAGLVLTVGMAVDTNVIIFERIKDKMKEGRSFAQSIDRGFDSAFSTIIDANFTTMITAVVLYAIGNGPIQGFALTLGLGLLTSMFTGIFASRVIINMVYGRNTQRNLKV
ncbi:protein translocase subunit SecD [uncultured Shewanella sp.]|uniref:protein translocase subunit SecD n=1 Tax=uncultured Shewanella sp. TaxID=173975 RepID=UPI002627F4F2|nr:protein translocase subunit SecD [uncultured Shewanella sp.]